MVSLSGSRFLPASRLPLPPQAVRARVAVVARASRAVRRTITVVVLLNSMGDEKASLTLPLPPTNIESGIAGPRPGSRSRPRYPLVMADEGRRRRVGGLGESAAQSPRRVLGL